MCKNVARNRNIPKFCKTKQFEAAFCHVKILRLSTKKIHLFPIFGLYSSFYLFFLSLES